MTPNLTDSQTSFKSNRIARQMQENYMIENFKNLPMGSLISGKGIPVVTDATYNLLYVGASVLYTWNINAQALIIPAYNANGLDISMDQTAGDGIEISPAYGVNANTRFGFVIDTAPKGFFVRAKISVSDVSDVAELSVGFRKNATAANALSSHTDYALLQLIAGDIKTETRLNTGTASTVDTTLNWADAGTYTLRVDVAVNGKTTFTVLDSNDVVVSTGFVSQDFQFDTGDTVIPCIRQILGTDGTCSIILKEFECGYQHV